MKVLAVDPGKATGFAEWTQRTDGVELFRAWTDESWLSACETIDTLVDVDLLVYEKYNISQQTLTKTKDAHWAMGMIGVIRFNAERKGIDTLGQNPGDRLGVKQAHLNALGWRATSHAKEAARHLALALVAQRLIDPRRMIQSS